MTSQETSRDTSPVIKCENVSVVRGSATILQQVSLHANRGELVAILGPTAQVNQPCLAFLLAISNPIVAAYISEIDKFRN